FAELHELGPPGRASTGRPALARTPAPASGALSCNCLLLRPDRRKQSTVAHQVGVAANRRGEVAVAGRVKAGVTEILRRVASLLERAQDKRGERYPAGSGTAHVGIHAAGDLADQVRSLGGEQGIGHRRRGDPQRGKLLHEPADALGIGTLVDAVETWDRGLGKTTRDGFVRGDHEMLDQAVGLCLGARLDRADVAVLVEAELGLLGVDRERPARLARSLQVSSGGPGRAKRATPWFWRRRGAREDAIDLLVVEAHIGADRGAIEARGLE